MRPCASDRGGNVLLLDVHMERVEKEADVVGFDVVNQPERRCHENGIWPRTIWKSQFEVRPR